MLAYVKKALERRNLPAIQGDQFRRFMRSRPCVLGVVSGLQYA